MAIVKKHHFITEAGDKFLEMSGGQWVILPPGSIVIQISRHPDPNELVRCRVCGNKMNVVFDGAPFVGRHCPNNCPPARHEQQPAVPPPIPLNASVTLQGRVLNILITLPPI